VGTTIVLTIFAVLLVRLIESKFYKIPFRMTYSGLYEHINILPITLIGVFLALFPIWGFVFSDVENTSIALIAVILLILPIIFVGRQTKLSKNEKDGGQIIVRWSGIAAGFLYLFIGFCNHGDHVVAFIANVLTLTCKAIFFSGFIACIALNLTGERKIYGTDGTFMTTKIDGKPYLVAVRHSSDKWIFFPYREDESKSNLFYENDEFIIRNLDNLVIQRKKGFMLKKLPVDEGSNNEGQPDGDM